MHWASVENYYIMNKQQQTFVINALRRASFKWRPRNQAKLAAKVQIGEFSTGRPKYNWQCTICGELFKAKDTQMDHVDPVVPLEGFKSGKEFDLEEFVERLLCYEKGWQCICKSCHDKKSSGEAGIRATRKRKEKGVEEKPKKPRKSRTKKK